MSKLILILALLGFCLTEGTDACFTGFKSFLDTECAAIKSTCKYYIPINKCTTPKADCSEGTSATCTSIILDSSLDSSLKTKTCNMEGTPASCQLVDKVCEDYNSDWGDTCTLSKPKSADKGERCDFSYLNKCTPHFNSCENTNIKTQEQCYNNIPSDVKTRCVWKDSKCQPEDRLCSDTFSKINSGNCHSLTNTKQNCYYLDKACIDYYPTCEDYKSNNKTICENIKPVNAEGVGYDITKNCTFDRSCVTKSIMCEDYILKDEEDYETCPLLTVSDSHKKCIYDLENGKCKEEYKSCEEYNGLSTKKKEICENITLDDVTKKCVFKDNACETVNKGCSDYKSYEPKKYCTEKIPTVLTDSKKTCKLVGSECVEDYISCTDYDGQDKKTCESIIVDDGKCFLENDITCTKRKLFCSETKTEDECWSAESENSRKYCLYYGGQCIEMYSACENYIGYYKQECEAIVTGRGTTCSFQSPNCLSIFKSCSEALNSDECTLINLLNSQNDFDPTKSRLSDPKKMICEYDSTSGCIENYKYCNDYKGTDAAVCENIKSQIATTITGIGTFYNPDSRYKCVYNEKTGCERQLLDCSEAKTSAACSAISSVLITDSGTTKYCLFFNGTCTEQYYQCSDYKDNVQKEKCKAIMPYNRQTHYCDYKDESGKISCVEKANDCESFDVDKYKYECTKLGPFCSYSDGVCSTIAKTCSEIVFPIEWAGDKSKTCSGIEVEDENKICSLSSDETKCEEVDKPSEKEETPAASTSAATTQNNESQDDDSDSSNLLNLKRINLILILLYLLI